MKNIKMAPFVNYLVIETSLLISVSYQSNNNLMAVLTFRGEISLGKESSVHHVAFSETFQAFIVKSSKK